MKMKKLFALMLSCIMIISITACGNSKYVGTWELEQAEQGGMAVSAEMMGGMTLELNKGGKGKMSAAGESNDIEWEVKDNKLKMTHDGDSIETPVKVENGKLILENFEGVKMTFKKK